MYQYQAPTGEEKANYKVIQAYTIRKKSKQTNKIKLYKNETTRKIHSKFIAVIIFGEEQVAEASQKSLSLTYTILTF